MEELWIVEVQRKGKEGKPMSQGSFVQSPPWGTLPLKLPVLRLCGLEKGAVHDRQYSFPWKTPGVAPVAAALPTA